MRIYKGVFFLKKVFSVVLVLAMLSATMFTASAAKNRYEGIYVPRGAEEQLPDVADPLSDLPVFPHAEGYAKYITGGRGGLVYHVTSLAPSGPGTLVNGIMTNPATPRTIVFDVDGYIEWPHSAYPMSNVQNLTIAGQTAPGEGITITTDNFYLSGASNVIIRFMHFRHGQATAKDDSFFSKNGTNIMIDHCSFEWGSDECMSARWNTNLTIQWSIMADGVRTHSMGGLQEWNSLTTHHCLYANQNDRNPKAKGFTDFENNVLYNWGEYGFVAGGNSGGEGWANIINNYFVAGPDTRSPYKAIFRGNGKYMAYVAGNLIDSNKNGILDGTNTGLDMITGPDSSTKFTERLNVDGVCVVVMNKRIGFPELSHVDDALTAYNKVMDYAGASLHRDQIDKDIIEAVRNQTGKILLHHDETTGYPEIISGTPKKDTDQDGMPDEWESAKGLNPNNAEDRNNIAPSGYTYLEEYLNELVEGTFPPEDYQNPPEKHTVPRKYVLQLGDETYDMYNADKAIMVPLKPIADYLGFTTRVAEDGESMYIEKVGTRDVQINLDPKPGEWLIEVGINSYPLSKWTNLGQAPEYKNGQLYVPIQMVSLQMGAVYYQTLSEDGDTGIFTISHEDYERFSAWAR